MAFSSVLRRCTLLRSLRSNSFAGTPTYAPSTSRMVTTVTSTAPAPWLRIQPSLDYDYMDGSSFKFYCLEDDKIHSFFHCSRGDSVNGSSQGWMVLYGTENHYVGLLDPTTDRIVTLPSIGGVLHRLIVDEKARLAVAAVGSGGRLALCWPHRSSEWTLFPSERACDSLTYSSRHSRLFCITRDGDGSDLEIWDVQGEREGEAPKLEWKMDLDEDADAESPNLKKLKYVACAEHSGEVYVVERNFKIRHGLSGRFVDDAVCSEYRGGPYDYTPYQTTNFKVYKVDREGRRLIRMKGSLDGVAIFIGLNEPMAIPASEVAGVKPDSIYFTYDRRIRYKDYEGIKYMHDEVGRLDYSNGNFKPAFISNINRDHLQNLMWFSPPKH